MTDTLATSYLSSTEKIASKSCRTGCYIEGEHVHGIDHNTDICTRAPEMVRLMCSQEKSIWIIVSLCQLTTSSINLLLSADFSDCSILTPRVLLAHLMLQAVSRSLVTPFLLSTSLYDNERCVSLDLI